MKYCLMVFIILFSLNLPARSEFIPFKIELNYHTFSPNGDGSQDYILIRVKDLVKGLRNPFNWECEIRNQVDDRVYKWKADKRLRRTEPSIGNLFLPSDDNVKPVSLFNELLWDGRDQEGRIVPDGTYSIRIRIVDSQTSRIHTRTVTSLIVDTKPPELELKAIKARILQQPNLNLSGQSFLLNQQSRKTGSGASFTAQLFTYSGILVYEKKWFNQLPFESRIQWNELSQNESDSVGRYRYRLIARDQAGNSSFIDYSDLVVATALRNVIVRSDRPGFSPNLDGFGDSLKLEIAAINANGLVRNSGRHTNWKIQILNSALDTVVFEKQGSGKLSQIIYWNGKDRDGDTLSDGLYFARAFIQGQVASENLPIVIDTKAIDVSVYTDKIKFVPDGDGHDDLLPFQVQFPSSEIQSWQVALYLLGDVSSKPGEISTIKKLYRMYRGHLKPVSFLWDGKSDDGLYAESYESFVIVYEAWDWFGNRSVVYSNEIKTGLLLRPIQAGERKLVARIPLQNYFNSENQLTSQGRKLFIQVHAALKSYGLYKYQIETHSSAMGREENNLIKTEKQSRSIKSFLVNSGWAMDRYQTRGFGETELLNEKNSEFVNYRNARIELRLVL